MPQHVGIGQRIAQQHLQRQAREREQAARARRREHALSPTWTLGLKVNNLTNTTVPVAVGYTSPPREVLGTLRGSW